MTTIRCGPSGLKEYDWLQAMTFVTSAGFHAPAAINVGFLARWTCLGDVPLDLHEVETRLAAADTSSEPVEPVQEVLREVHQLLLHVHAKVHSAGATGPPDEEIEGHPLLNRVHEAAAKLLDRAICGDAVIITASTVACVLLVPFCSLLVSP